jgi:hypothetical protein
VLWGLSGFLEVGLRVFQGGPSWLGGGLEKIRGGYEWSRVVSGGSRGPRWPRMV